MAPFILIGALLLGAAAALRVSMTWAPRSFGRNNPSTRFTLANVLTRPFSLVEMVVKRHPKRFQPNAPAFDPISWAPCRYAANCYTYVLDILPSRWVLTSALCRPGEVEDEANNSTRRLSWRTVRSGFRSDGLRPATLRSLLERPGNRYLVAVMFDPRSPDYHLVRLDADGEWSHKPGSDPVSRSDSVGRRIVSPRRMVTNNKYWFMGYFWVVPDTNLVRERQYQQATLAARLLGYPVPRR